MDNVDAPEDMEEIEIEEYVAASISNEAREPSMISFSESNVATEKVWQSRSYEYPGHEEDDEARSNSQLTYIQSEVAMYSSRSALWTGGRAFTHDRRFELGNYHFNVQGFLHFMYVILDKFPINKPLRTRNLPPNVVVFKDLSFDSNEENPTSRLEMKTVASLLHFLNQHDFGLGNVAPPYLKQIRYVSMQNDAHFPDQTRSQEEHDRVFSAHDIMPFILFLLDPSSLFDLKKCVNEYNEGGDLMAVMGALRDMVTPPDSRSYVVESSSSEDGGQSPRKRVKASSWTDDTTREEKDAKKPAAILHKAPTVQHVHEQREPQPCLRKLVLEAEFPGRSVEFVGAMNAILVACAANDNILKSLTIRNTQCPLIQSMWELTSTNVTTTGHRFRGDERVDGGNTSRLALGLLEGQALDPATVVDDIAGGLDSISFHDFPMLDASGIGLLEAAVRIAEKFKCKSLKVKHRRISNYDHLSWRDLIASPDNYASMRVNRRIPVPAGTTPPSRDFNVDRATYVPLDMAIYPPNIDTTLLDGLSRCRNLQHLSFYGLGMFVPKTNMFNKNYWHILPNLIADHHSHVLEGFSRFLDTIFLGDMISLTSVDLGKCLDPTSCQQLGMVMTKLRMRENRDREDQVHIRDLYLEMSPAASREEGSNLPEEQRPLSQFTMALTKPNDSRYGGLADLKYLRGLHDLPVDMGNQLFKSAMFHNESITRMRLGSCWCLDIDNPNAPEQIRPTRKKKDGPPLPQALVKIAGFLNRNEIKRRNKRNNSKAQFLCNLAMYSEAFSSEEIDPQQTRDWTKVGMPKEPATQGGKVYVQEYLLSRGWESMHQLDMIYTMVTANTWVFTGEYLPNRPASPT